MQRNPVTVKIWCPSETTSSPKSWLAKGHVALYVYNPQTSSTRYISFWPGFACSAYYYDPRNVNDPNYQREGFQSICKNDQDHIHDQVTDELVYQRPCDKEYHLNNLSPAVIEAEFDRRMRLGIRWTLSSSILFLNNDNVANCCSLVYDLLKNAGFDNLINQKTRVTIGTAQSARYGVLFGSLSALMFASKLLEWAKSFSIAQVRVFSEKDNCWHFFQFYYYPYPEMLRKLNAAIRNIEGRRFISIKKIDPNNGLLKLIVDIHNRYPNIPFSPHASTKAKLIFSAIMVLLASLMAAGLFSSRKAVANYLIVKPTDFIAWLENIKAQESRIYGNGNTLFENVRKQETPEQVYSQRASP